MAKQKPKPKNKTKAAKGKKRKPQTQKSGSQGTWPLSPEVGVRGEGGLALVSSRADIPLGSGLQFKA